MSKSFVLVSLVGLTCTVGAFADDNVPPGLQKKGGVPPGLAKKHNGCMPPGQAKKWKKGRPLPREVIYYDVPPALVVQIGTPPPGYRYVRVASDILMIAIGTGIVIDAIQDLGRM